MQPPVFVKKIQHLIERYKPYISALFFLGGFTWDNLTLQRIDKTGDMVIFGLFVLGAGVAITLIGSRLRFPLSQFLPWVVQWFFGGLFSAFFVYYVKSASSLPTLVFIGLIITVLVGNEFLEKKYGDITLSSLLYALASFMYLNAFIPVLVLHMNMWTFFAALTLSGLCIAAIRKFSRNTSVKLWPPALLYLLLTLFYFTNVIPPVPLAKKDMGIYRQIHTENNRYICTYEKPPWHHFWRVGEKSYAWLPGDTVFCYSSIFAPAKLRKKIAHQWYYRDPREKRYLPRDRIAYSIQGGREDGYRGYTYKTNIQPGKWKVELQTQEGKTLGTIHFHVHRRDSDSSLRTFATKAF